MAQITIVFDTKTETLEDVLSDMNWGQRAIKPESLEEAEEEAEEEAVELDSDGVPWDERIHSSNRKMTKKGVWTRQRGIDPSYFDEVYAELKTGVAIPSLPISDDAPPPPPPADAPPPPPPPLNLETSSVEDGEWNWNTLVKSLSQAIKSGEVSKADQDSALKEVGVELFPLLSVRTDLYNAFAAKLGLKQ